MPSFFEGMKRIIQGEPVFDESESSDSPTAPTPGDIREDSENKYQPKQLPQVVIERFEYDEDGEDITYDFAIQNNSTVTVELDKILLLSTHHEINDHLRPGEEREFRVFDDKKPKTPPVTYCELVFKELNGDYFKAIHYIESEKEADGSYRIRRIKFLPPIRDI